MAQIGMDGMVGHRWHGWGKNQGFTVISDLYFSTMIGCGGEHNQSE